MNSTSGETLSSPFGSFLVRFFLFLSMMRRHFGLGRLCETPRHGARRLENRRMELFFLRSFLFLRSISITLRRQRDALLVRKISKSEKKNEKKTIVFVFFLPFSCLILLELKKKTNKNKRDALAHSATLRSSVNRPTGGVDMFSKKKKLGRFTEFLFDEGRNGESGNAFLLLLFFLPLPFVFPQVQR